VNVQTAGYYALDFRVASNGIGGTFHFEVEGNDVTEALTVPNTGGWQKWTTIRKNGAYLYAGTNVLRLAMDSNGPTGWVGNFNHMEVSPVIVNLSTATAAHVRDGSYQFTKFGASPTLEVKKSTPSYNREAFLKFDLSELTSVSNAKLRALGWTPRFPTFEEAMSGSILASFGF